MRRTSVTLRDIDANRLGTAIKRSSRKPTRNSKRVVKFVNQAIVSSRNYPLGGIGTGGVVGFLGIHGSKPRVRKASLIREHMAAAGTRRIISFQWSACLESLDGNSRASMRLGSTMNATR